MDAGKLLLTLLLFGTSAQAFDWNGKTIGNVADFGKMSVRCGHPLATYRSFQLLAREAKERSTRGDTELEKALALVYGERSLDEFTDTRSTAFQTTLFGNWLNEVNTNIDLEGGWMMTKASEFLQMRYEGEATVCNLDKIGDCKDSATGDVPLSSLNATHSHVWDAATGYSSTNFRHSMMVESKDAFHPLTQDDSFDRITENYAYHSISAAIQGLLDNLVARAEKAELKDNKTFLEKISGLKDVLAQKVSVSARNEYKGDFRYIDALSNLGGVLHLVQDSSVACTPRAKQYVPGCIEGDGHGIIRKVGDREQVVWLADDKIYQTRKSFHGDLDGLYCPDKIEAVYGKTDPALAGAGILREVALSVYRQYNVWNKNRVKAVGPDGNITAEFAQITNEASKEAAKNINNGFVRTRYAAKENRLKESPKIPERDMVSEESGKGVR